jgi:uncharacterized protein (DUF433 family)
MAIQLKQHIEIRGDGNPLDVVIAGTRLKAYLVANFALLDGVEAALEQYEPFKIEAAQIHAAITFSLDNDAAIQAAIAEMRELGRKLGSRDAAEHLAELRSRSKK